MRYLYTLFAVAYAVSGIGAGEVWVVKPATIKQHLTVAAPKSVWVVRKTERISDKQEPSKELSIPAFCRQEPKCVCGCNAGKPCTCGNTAGQLFGNPEQLLMLQLSGNSRQLQSTVCLPGG